MDITQPSTADPPTEGTQVALADAIRNFARDYEEGIRVAPFPDGHEVTQTDVAIVASKILKAVDIELFELAMWEVWNSE